MTRRKPSALEQLDKLRTEQPKAYDAIMVALAQLVAAAREAK